MHKLLFCTLLFIYCSSAFAQNKEKDSLFLSIKDGRAMVIHEVKKDENLYSIAQIYSVPALVLSQNNDVPFYEKLEPKRKLLIPMGNYNYQRAKSQNPNTKALYYKIQNGDSYAKLSSALSMPEEQLKILNNGLDFKTNVGEPLLSGWILYQSFVDPVAGNMINPIPSVELAPVPKLAKTDTLKGPPSELELIYEYQTTNETYLDSLSGMVVFFKPQTTVNNKLLYAFSNDLARGRVVKIINPSNQKFIFAKVIGPLPATKQYMNAKIGVDGRARAELETREVKLWCDFKFKY